jgi:hypothetical protein
VKPHPEPESRESTLRKRNREEKANETLAKLLQEHENQVKERSRIDAEKLLIQIEDAFAKLCEDNDVTKAAIQLITERSSHIPTYTPGGSTPWYSERRDYGEATVTVGGLYGSLTQLLGRITREPDSSVGFSVWRILDSYHPNLRFRFYQEKAKRRHP